jgi:hypothetical protein
VYEPTTYQEALSYVNFCWATYDKEVCPQLSDWPHLLPRQRRVSVTRLIKQARKAGERGAVRVEIFNHDGTRTVVTSSREAQIDAMTEADAEKLWTERIGKHAH